MFEITRNIYLNLAKYYCNNCSPRKRTGMNNLFKTLFIYLLDLVSSDPELYPRLMEWVDQMGLAIRNDMKCILQEIKGFSKHVSFLNDLAGKSLANCVTRFPSCL